MTETVLALGTSLTEARARYGRFAGFGMIASPIFQVISSSWYTGCAVSIHNEIRRLTGASVGVEPAISSVRSAIRCVMRSRLTWSK